MSRETRPGSFGKNATAPEGSLPEAGGALKRERGEGHCRERGGREEKACERARAGGGLTSF